MGQRREEAERIAQKIASDNGITIEPGETALEAIAWSGNFDDFGELFSAVLAEVEPKSEPFIKAIAQQVARATDRGEEGLEGEEQITLDGYNEIADYIESGIETYLEARGQEPLNATGRSYGDMWERLTHLKAIGATTVTLDLDAGEVKCPIDEALAEWNMINPGEPFEIVAASWNN